MNAPLSESERELISAWLDDEVGDEERAQVEKLLEREDAAQFLYEIRATRELAIEHARVRAPVGLHARVLNSLKGEFKSRPANAVPVFNWRTPLLAAAAVLLLSLGIMFGPSLFGPADTQPPSIAREDLDEFRANDAPESATGGARAENARADSSPAARIREIYESAGDDSGVRKDDRRALSPADKTGDAEAGAPSAEPDSRSEEHDSEPQILGGTAKSRPRAARGAREAAESEDQADGGVTGGRGSPGKNEEGGAGALAAPGDDANEPVEIVIAARGPAALNDVVWVSSLHGDVSFIEDADGLELLRVDLNEDRVDGLRRALGKLVREQGYGVESPEARDAEEAAGTGISGYLPAPAKLADLSQGAETRSVTVTVRLE